MSNYEPNETVTITLQRFMDMQEDTEDDSEVKHLEASLKSLEAQYDHLSSMLDRIAEVVDFQDFAEFQTHEEKYDKQMDKIKKILSGGN